jgi:hypothetical protein
MARRANLPRDELLTEKQLKDLQRWLEVLNPSHVENFYRESHRECCLT